MNYFEECFDTKKERGNAVTADNNASSLNDTKVQRMVVRNRQLAGKPKLRQTGNKWQAHPVEKK